MNGNKWKKTINATVTALSLLRPNYDRFGIIFFDQNTEHYSEKLILANEENIKNAIRYVENKSVGGATNINSALLESIDFIENDILSMSFDALKCNAESMEGS